MNKKEVALFWFRRDLRLKDNRGLFEALNSKYSVLPIFIFDEEILSELPKSDARVSFIYQSLSNINKNLNKVNSSLKVLYGKPLNCLESLIKVYNIKEIYYNKDYEPYAINRDTEVTKLCKVNGINTFSFKDQVIFEESEILKADGKPYTVYTPYKNKWIEKYQSIKKEGYPSETLISNCIQAKFKFPTLTSLGFQKSSQKVLAFNSQNLKVYQNTRDIPFLETSNVSVHLRFGTVSTRKLVAYALKTNSVYLSELIWREFFMQILFHFPTVVNNNFKQKYNYIPWRNNKQEFKNWCEGKTGYPIVDAGMRQLNSTGYMHNRVRMIVASFLCKHLLIDWRWGEAYFAEKLLDFELSSNNGNWQWVAGTGCDAAPYFRVFNPLTQQQKFDPLLKYVKKWNPNYETLQPIVDHKYARERYLKAMAQ
jgi:deoxyribodipyrimidine photo-lyase